MIYQSIVAIVLLATAPFASATRFELIPATAGAGFSFTWLHNGSVPQNFSDTNGNSYTYYPGGALTRVTSVVAPLAGTFDESTQQVSDLAGIFNLQDGGVLSFSNGDLDFGQTYGNGNQMGSLDYTVVGSSAVSDHSGTVYFDNMLFASASYAATHAVPNALLQTGSSTWEARLWGNNWVVQDGSGGSIAPPTTNALGLDLAFRIPDGGMTAMLLGLSMCGLGFVRRAMG